MLETSIDAKQKQYLDAIKTSCENLLVIINDVLDLSKLEAGKMDLEKISFDVNKQIQIVHDTLRFKAEERGLSFDIQIESNIPRLIIGDPSRLNQVLINLCGNAIKFTDNGSVSLHVKKGLIGRDNALKFTITDSGIGMSKEQLTLLFTSFQQADSSTSRKYGGTGLGLSISKTLIELQNGTIEVKSEEGKGSEFTVLIPYEFVDKHVEDEASGVIVNDKSSLNGIRILVAEDNEFNQIVVKDTLEKLIENVSIDIAENGKIAIEKHEKNEYDIILMDVNMPEMDGHAATIHIRNNMDENKKTIPIIALTASVLKSEIQKCEDSGMNEFIPKPFSNEELLGALNKYYG
jgi:CheY-like chemotaxis protein